MRKFFVISLSLLIVILSFSLCFADTSPVILPVSDSESLGGYPVTLNNVTYYYSADSSPVYLVFANVDGATKKIMFSDNPNTHVFYSRDGSLLSTYNLTSQYDGFYYQSAASVDNQYLYPGEFTSVTDVIDDINNSVFSTSFDLTYLVNGSVSWLSTFAQAVKNSPLLLFFVVFIFVGIGIGLLNRFRRG